MDQVVDGICQDQIRALGYSRIGAIANAECGESYRIELTRDGQVSITLKLLEGGSGRWSRFAIRLAEMVTGDVERSLSLHDRFVRLRRSNTFWSNGDGFLNILLCRFLRRSL